MTRTIPFISGLLIFLATGCISIKGSFRGLTSYYKISKKECGPLFCTSDSALDSEKDSCVIKLSNGKAVKAFLSGFNQSVVYIWLPDCHSTSCPDINWVREKCESKNLKLLIVQEYFDCNRTLIFFDKAHPVIGIDTRYYKSDFTTRYLRKFLFDLTGNRKNDISAGCFFFFEKGKYVSQQQNL